MNGNEKPDEPLRSKFFTKDGKPLRILSTSLGIALIANAAMLPAASAADTGTADSGATSQPKLVEWSSEAVKAYFDPAVDWNIPIPEDIDGEEDKEGTGESTSGGTGSGSGSTTTIINTNSGFGWDDLILYHLLFNRGSAYSSSYWSSSHPTYYYGTSNRYKPRTYASGTFQNKPVVGSSVRPKTSSSSGSITRRSKSSSPGGIGGKSSTFGSSSKSSSSHSSGGFGG